MQFVIILLTGYGSQKIINASFGALYVTLFRGSTFNPLLWKVQFVVYLV